MKNSKWMTGLLLFTSGCASMNNTEAGAVNGGIIGDFMGAVVGAVATRNPMGLVYGAAAGEALGAGVGAANGNAIDRAQQHQVQAVNDANDRAIYEATHPPLSLEQIAAMSRRGDGDRIIVNQIVSTGSTYLLSTDQIGWLRANNVSNYVIEFMQARGPAAYYQPRPYVVAPAAPPVAVGIGVGIR